MGCFTSNRPKVLDFRITDLFIKAVAIVSLVLTIVTQAKATILSLDCDFEGSEKVIDHVWVDLDKSFRYQNEIR